MEVSPEFTIYDVQGHFKKAMEGKTVYYTQSGREIEDAEMDNMKAKAMKVTLRTQDAEAVLRAMSEVGLDRFDGPEFPERTLMVLSFLENDEFEVRQWIAGAFACGLIVSGEIER